MKDFYFPIFLFCPLQDKCQITSNTIIRLLSTQWWGINNEIRINSFHGIKVELNWPLGQQTDHPKPDQTRHLAQTRHCRSVEPHFIPRADYRRKSLKNNIFLPITRGLVMETLRLERAVCGVCGNLSADRKWLKLVKHLGVFWGLQEKICS